jgi:ferrochelatase
VPSQVSPYDALLLVSFGGPERPEDVVPFLENVTRGRGIPRERLEAVGQHYYLFGGRSPINDLNRDLLSAVRADLAEAGIQLPVYWGNRNWDPYLTDVLAEMAADGVTRAACFVTSAYSSWSGCRQYRENLYDAVAPLGVDAPRLDKLRHYFNHPGFVEPVAEAVVEAWQELPGDARDGAQLVFVTHSIPLDMNDRSGPSGGAYVEQHLDVAEAVTARVTEETGRRLDHALAYCSRSGPPSMPWLEPDVNDHLTQLAADGATGAVLVPVGFVADHMEVVYDLDTEALETARELQLPAVRSATPQGDARFATMVRELLVERAAAERGEPVERPTTGRLGPLWDACPVGCCANPAGDRPALCGSDR